MEREVFLLIKDTIKELVAKLNFSKQAISILLKAVAVILVLGIVFWGYQTFSKPPVIPERVLDQGIKATLAAESFRFNLEYKNVTDEKEEVWSQIKGEKAGEDKIHITGEMVKTPVEIFQVGNKTYIKNPIDTWTVLDENDIHQQELLVNEINPLAIFAFKEIPEVKYKGTKELDGDEYYVIEYIPDVANQFIEVLATDFIYKSWVNVKTNLIGKTTVEATSRGEGKGKLFINVDFYDYKAEINLEVPKVD